MNKKMQGTAPFTNINKTDIKGWLIEADSER